MNSEERRSKQRFNVHQFVDISYMKEDFIPVEGINLSETGLLVRSDSPVEPYTKIFFMVSLGDDEEPIKGEGVSIRCEESEGSFYIGVQVIDMKDSDKLCLHSFLENFSEGTDRPKS